MSFFICIVKLKVYGPEVSGYALLWPKFTLKDKKASLLNS